MYFGQFDDIDGITSEYVAPSMFDSVSMANTGAVVGSLLAAGILYKMCKKKRVNEDDEFVKEDQKGIFERLYNPFSRNNNNKKDKDDDFDHVV